MRGSKSAITAQENDHGIVTANSEKMTGQIWAGVKKASKMLGITRSRERKKNKEKTENIMMSLHKSVVYILQLLHATTFPFLQPSTHPKSL